MRICRSADVATSNAVINLQLISLTILNLFLTVALPMDFSIFTGHTTERVAVRAEAKRLRLTAAFRCYAAAAAATQLTFINNDVLLVHAAGKLCDFALFRQRTALLVSCGSDLLDEVLSHAVEEPSDDVNLHVVSRRTHAASKQQVQILLHVHTRSMILQNGSLCPGDNRNVDLRSGRFHSSSKTRQQ